MPKHSVSISYQSIDHIKRLAAAAACSREGEMALVQAVTALSPEERIDFLLLELLGRADAPQSVTEPPFALDHLLHPLLAVLNEAASRSAGEFEPAADSYPPRNPREVHLVHPGVDDPRVIWLTASFGDEAGGVLSFRVKVDVPILPGELALSSLICQCRQDADASDVRAEVDRIIRLFDQQLVVGRPRRCEPQI